MAHMIATIQKLTSNSVWLTWPRQHRRQIDYTRETDFTMAHLTTTTKMSKFDNAEYHLVHMATTIQTLI